MATNFHETSLGILVDACNELSNRIEAGQPLLQILEQYPETADELLALCNELDGTPDTQEIYSCFEAFCESAGCGCHTEDEMIRLWRDCIDCICICRPDKARYVVNVSLPALPAKAMKGRIPTPREMKNAYEKLSESGVLDRPIREGVLLKFPFVYSGLIEAMIDVGYLTRLRDGSITVSLMGVNRPDFVGVFGSGGKQKPGLDTSGQSGSLMDQMLGNGKRR